MTRHQFFVGLCAIAFMTLSLVLAATVEPLIADDQSNPKVAARNNPQEKSVEFEGRLWEISADAIRFHGNFVLPTNASTSYFRVTENGEMRIERSELDQLTEELDEDPFKSPLLSGGGLSFEIPSFKLGGRIRCEYVPGQSATKVVIQSVTDEERRTRTMFMSVSRELERPPEELSQDGFNRKVSLKARAMPLKVALTELARSARLPLELDVPALTRAKIDLNSPITIEVIDEPLQAALLRLLDWNSFQGAYGELRGGKWYVTTIDANTLRLNSILPDWLRPGTNPGLYPRLDDDDNVVSLQGNVASDEVLARLKTLQKLRELDIHGMKGVTPAAFAVLAKLDSVERLSLRVDRDCNSQDADEIAKHVGRMKSLRVLTLSETGITDEGVSELSGLPLTDLNLYQEGRVTDHAIAEIARLKHLKSLRLTTYVSTEKLGSMRFTSQGLGQLSALRELERLDLAGQPAPRQLAAFPKLTSLQLDGPLASDMGRIEVLDDDGADEIAEASRLKYLIISRHQISARGWRRIGTLPELRGISLPDDITDSEIENLKVHGLPKLTQIRLTANSATEEGIGYLSGFKSLTRLDLSGSNVTEETLLQLKALSNLRSLHLYGLSATTGYDGLKQLTQLQELYLERVPIKPSAYNKLETSLLKTRIYAGHGTRWLWSIRDQK